MTSGKASRENSFSAAAELAPRTPACLTIRLDSDIKIYKSVGDDVTVAHRYYVLCLDIADSAIWRLLESHKAIRVWVGYVGYIGSQSQVLPR